MTLCASHLKPIAKWQMCLAVTAATGSLAAAAIPLNWHSGTCLGCSRGGNAITALALPVPAGLLAVELPMQQL